MLASLVACATLVLGQAPASGRPQPPETTTPAAGSGSESERLVFISDQRITADVGVEPPELTIRVVVHNRLPVALVRVELGALLALEAGQLENVDAGRLYASDQSSTAIAVVRRAVVIAVPAGGAVPIEIRIAGDRGGAPAFFQTHLLGFSLAEVRVESLTALLATEVAADEVAATNALAIGGVTAAKRRVRERFAADNQLIGDLRRLLSAPIPEAPDALATHVRLLAVLGLGVVGGDEARAALETFGRSASVDAFDEALQVVRAARLTGSRFEAPLAFALSADARTMKDVVAAAVRDLDGGSSAPDVGGGVGAGIAADTTDVAQDAWQPEPRPPTMARPGLGMPLAILVGVVVFFATWLLLRRRA